MEQASDKTIEDTLSRNKNDFLAYGLVMFFILTIGFLGNVLTLLILRRPEHRRCNLTPLMINLALADIFIIVFGYPVVIQAYLRGILSESSHCSWGAFVNGTVGIACIFTLTEMSMVSYFGLKQVNRNSRFSARQNAYLIGASWLYGGICMLPPLLGWNRFVVSASRLSCCPDWVGRSPLDTAYNLLLVLFGFFIPIVAILICYYKIYSLVHRNVVPGNVEVQLRQRSSKMKLVRITATAVAAVMLSWAPYSFVSLAATFTRKQVIELWEAEIPELLAKASVVYNPVIYIVMNSQFRASLFRIIRLRRRITPHLIAKTNRPIFRLDTYHRHNNIEQSRGISRLKIPLAESQILGQVTVSDM